MFTVNPLTLGRLEGKNGGFTVKNRAHVLRNTGDPHRKTDTLPAHPGPAENASRNNSATKLMGPGGRDPGALSSHLL